MNCDTLHSDHSFLEEPERRLLAHVAQAISARGLEHVASLFLELHKPLLSLAHTGYLFLEPTLTPFFGAERVGTLRALLQKPEAVEFLLSLLEQDSAATDGASR